MHGVGGPEQPATGDRWLAGAEIARKPWMRPACHQQPNPRSRRESVCNSVEFDSDETGLPGTSDERVGYVARAALGVHLADPDEHVVVRVVAAVLQFGHRGADHVQIGGQRVTGVGQHIGAPGQPRVVAIPGFARQQPTADRRQSGWGWQGRTRMS